jgi:hypothetical protein
MDRMGIVLFVEFRPQKEEIEKHGIGNQLCNLEEGAILQVNGRNFPDDLKDEDNDRRA